MGKLKKGYTKMNRLKVKDLNYTRGYKRRHWVHISKWEIAALALFCLETGFVLHYILEKIL